MREAIGGSQLLMIIVTIIVIVMMLLASSIGYSKAFKARNAILNIVQENGGYGISANTVLEHSKDEIVSLLNEMGYKTSVGSNRSCTDRSSSKYSEYEEAKDYNYNFCVYRYIDAETGNQYYGVETYMYFELPLFGKNDRFAIPMYADSYTFFKYGMVGWIYECYNFK